MNKKIYKHSEETKRKIGLANKGRKCTEETRKKMSIMRRGSRHPLWGKHHSEITKKKMRLAKLGKKHSKKWIEKNREWMLKNNPFRGKKHSKESRKKISLSRIGKSSWNKGKKRPQFSKEWRKKMSETHKRLKLEPPHYWGEKHPNWQGGIARLPYPYIFNKELKLEIRERDNFTCQLCGKTEKEELRDIKRVLSINHIDYDKKNCNPENLNTLCCRCNSLVNGDRKKWTKYFQSLV